MKALAATVMSLSVAAAAGGAATAQTCLELTIARAGSQPSSQGPADYFTGSVRVDPLFRPSEPARTSAAYVTFEPGVKHCHGAAQYQGRV